jgi:hypothetical protein
MEEEQKSLSGAKTKFVIFRSLLGTKAGPLNLPDKYTLPRNFATDFYECKWEILCTYHAIEDDICEYEQIVAKS